MAREAAIVNAIIRYGNSLPGTLLRKLHGSGYSTSGDPDIYGSVGGVCVQIEVKQPGKRPTPLQLRRIEEWARAGAVAGWVSSVEDAACLLDEARQIELRRS